MASFTRNLAAAAIVTAFSVAPFIGGLTSAQALTPQQQRMNDCNVKASSQALKGDARKSFMSACLSGKSAPAGKPMTAQQQKMVDCNAQASTQKLGGEARKTFMKSCLKK